MKSKTFMYKGRKYEPIGNIVGGGFAYICNLIDYDKSYNNEFKNVDYNDFYKVAKKNKASCDLYKINDSNDYYILNGATGDLMTFRKVKNNAKIKYCEEYLRWYK